MAGILRYVTVRLDNLHWSVALHLASALLFLMSLVWIWLTAVRDKDEIPSWIEFDPILAKRWTKRIAILSFGTFLTLFLGVFVSTTPGANQLASQASRDLGHYVMTQSIKKLLTLRLNLKLFIGF